MRIPLDQVSSQWLTVQSLHGLSTTTSQCAGCSRRRSSRPTWRPRSFERAEHLLEALGEAAPDVLITDVRMPGMSGIALLDRLRGSYPDLPVIVITAHSDLENAVAAYKGGAFEYLPKPFDIDEAVDLVRKAARLNGGTPARVEAPAGEMASMIGQAPAMQEVFRSIGRLAGSSMTVLITGESGTGKELVARALHDHSPRANKPFVALNTSAIAVRASRVRIVWS